MQACELLKVPRFQQKRAKILQLLSFPHGGDRFSDEFIPHPSDSVITASFNFIPLCGTAEEHNAENLLVIHDATLAARYAQDWQRHADHSERYQ